MDPVQTFARACALADNPVEALFFAMQSHCEGQVSRLMFANANEAESVEAILAAAGWAITRKGGTSAPEPAA